MRPFPVYAGRLSEADKRAGKAFVGQCEKCKKFKFKTELVEVVIEAAEGSVVHIHCPSCAASLEASIILEKRARWGIDEDTANFLVRKFKSSVHNAAIQTRDRPHSLGLDEVFRVWVNQRGMCALTGLSMEIGTGLKQASIDRIDNRVGYENGNVHLVCWAVNLMKQTMTVKQLLHWSSAISDYAAFNVAIG